MSLPITHISKIGDGLETIMAQNNCITTKCMAWKFEKKKQTWEDTSKENKFCYPENAIDKFGYDNNHILSWSIYTEEGYCQRLRQ